MGSLMPNWCDGRGCGASLTEVGPADIESRGPTRHMCGVAGRAGTGRDAEESL